MQQKSSENKGLGDHGEDIAAEYLNKHGFKVIGRNIRYKCGEIDIVAKRKNELHFIEVRTRSNSNPVLPVETITSKKQAHIKKAAQMYLVDSRNGFKDKDFPPCYFDVIGIDLSSKNNQIEFIVDAFV